MYEIKYTSKFKKDYKRVKRQGRDLSKLENALMALQRGDALSERMRDHELGWNYKGHRECHLEPDWLLIYRVDGNELTLTATRTGSHSELFDE